MMNKKWMIGAAFGVGFVWSSALSASPFVMSKGQHNFGLSMTSTTTTELVTKSSAKEDRGNWEDLDYTIEHQALTLKHAVGIADKTDLTSTFTYKIIQENGTRVEGAEEDSFSGWSDASFSLKRSVYAANSIYAAVVGTFNAPASDYNPNKLVTPGAGAPEYVAGVTAAYVDTKTTNLMLGVDVGQAFRTGRAPDQTRYTLTLYHFGWEVLSGGLFYGGVQSTDGLDLGDEEFTDLAANGDQGNSGPPYARVNAAYNYAGVAFTKSVSGYDVSISYSQKLLDGARNTDINSNVTVGVSRSTSGS